MPLKEKKTVYSNPVAELPIQNAKYIKNCTEIFLGKRNIDKLNGFQVFVNLEVLWLNDNNIQELRGLENNFRLKELYLHCNKLSTLKGIRLPCKFLKRLTLYSNDITDLNSVIDCVSKLHTLEYLELQGNPCAEEPNYRIRIICQCPSIHVLDRHVVTEQERKQAAVLKQKRLKAEKRAKTESIRSAVHGSKTGEKGDTRSNHRYGGSIGDGGSSYAKSRSKLSRMTGADRTTENTSGLSGTVKILYRELARIDREEKEAEEQRTRENYAAAMQALEEQKELSGSKLASAVLPKAINFKHIEESKSANSIGAWQIYRLRKLFEAHDKDGGGELDVEEIKDVIKEMEDYGWVLGDGSGRCVELLFQEIDQDKSGQVSIEEFVNGMQEIMNDEAVAANNDDGDDDNDEDEPVEQLNVQWNRIRPEVALARSARINKKAMYMQAKALSLPENDSRKTELMKQAVEMSRRGSRLELLAKEISDEITFGKPPEEPELTGVAADTKKLENKRGDWLKYYHCEFTNAVLLEKQKKRSSYDDSDSDSDYEYDERDTDTSQKAVNRKNHSKDRTMGVSLSNPKIIPRIKTKSKEVIQNRARRAKLRDKFGLTVKNKDFKKFAEDKISQGGYDLSEFISEI